MLSVGAAGAKRPHRPFAEEEFRKDEAPSIRWSVRKPKVMAQFKRPLPNRFVIPDYAEDYGILLRILCLFRFGPRSF